MIFLAVIKFSCNENALQTSLLCNCCLQPLLLINWTDKLKDSSSSTVEQTSAPSSDAAAPSVASNVDYPPHETVTLPALSPTMTTGTIVSYVDYKYQTTLMLE